MVGQGFFTHTVPSCKQKPNSHTPFRCIFYRAKRKLYYSFNPIGRQRIQSFQEAGQSLLARPRHNRNRLRWTDVNLEIIRAQKRKGVCSLRYFESSEKWHWWCIKSETLNTFCELCDCWFLIVESEQLINNVKIQVSDLFSPDASFHTLILRCSST